MNINFLFFIFKLFAVVSAVNQYVGHKVYKLTPTNDVAVRHLEDLRRSGLGEFWDDYFEINLDARINVAPENLGGFEEFLKFSDIKREELIADIQSAIDNQLKQGSNARSAQPYLSYSWTEYHNLATIYAWLDELEAHHPEVVKTVVMGHSVLGVPIKGIVINYHPERGNKTIGILEGTIHAREWICPATITWIIKEFLTSSNAAVRTLAQSLEWHIFPVVNPDGYNYTFVEHRMWRKNRSPANLTTCPGNNDASHGVDLNRNFQFHWMGVGASNDPCSNLFAGPSPFSEPESRAIRDYMNKTNTEGKLVYYIGFHSFGQLILVPYSHVTEPDSLLASNYADMFEISIRAADALKKRYGTEYRVGLSASHMYPMSGTSFDYVKYMTNVPVALLLELRDRGAYGFLLPPDQIIAAATETMDALLEMDKTTRKLGYYRYNSGVGVFSSLAIIALSALIVLFV